MSYADYMSYVDYMNYASRLYQFYESCILYEYFMNCLKITWNHLKLVEITWSIIFSVFKKFEVFARIRMENSNYKNENIERKYLKNIQKYQFLKFKNSLLE